MFKRIKKIVSIVAIAGVLVTGVIPQISTYASGTVEKTWDVYYNDAHTNSITQSVNFSNYLGWYYATPTHRSSSTVYTIIQPNTSAGTNTSNTLYWVGAKKIDLYVSSSNGSTVYLIAKLSYITNPASMSGKVYHYN